mgnify:CR=1 FL=1
MPTYPTAGQKKLITNYTKSITEQIAAMFDDYDKFIDKDGKIKPNDRFLEIEDNKDVQNLISLLKHASDDLEDGEKEEFLSKYDRLREYFLLPSLDNLNKDTIKH